MEAEAVLANTNVVSQAANETADKMASLLAFIMHHATDSHTWTPLPYVTIQLPSFLSLHSLMLLFSSLILLFLFVRFRNHSPAAPHGLTNALEFFVQFIRDTIAIPNLGATDGRRLTPLLCSFFFFIMVTNMMGLVPVFATATSNVNVTGALAMITFCFMIFGAVYRNGLAAFIKGFVPHGIPWWVVVIMFPIEIAGVFIKTLALTIRLFANMLAGHIVIYALLGLIVVFGVLALPAMVIAVGIYALEVFVAIFQAFIFTLLSAVFIGQRYNPAH